MRKVQQYREEWQMRFAGIPLVPTSLAGQMLVDMEELERQVEELEEELSNYRSPLEWKKGQGRPEGHARSQEREWG